MPPIPGSLLALVVCEGELGHTGEWGLPPEPGAASKPAQQPRPEGHYPGGQLKTPLIA